MPFSGGPRHAAFPRDVFPHLFFQPAERSHLMKRKTTCLHRAALALLAACSLPHAHALYLVYMNPFMVEEHE